MYTYITKVEELSSFIKALSTTKSDVIGLDTETTGLDPFTDKLILIQAKIDDSIFIFHCMRLGEQITRYVVQLLQDSGKVLIGHNIKFDIKMIKTNTGELLTNVYDTQTAETLTYNGYREDRYPSLADLVKKYIGIVLDKSVRNNFIGNFAGNVTEEDLIYSALDVQHLAFIRIKQLEKLTEQKQLRVLEEESLLLPAVSSMELNGVLLDREKWSAISRDYVGLREQLRTELVEEIIGKVIEKNPFENAYDAVVYLKVLTKSKLSKKLVVQLQSITDLSFIKDFLIQNFNLGSPDQMLIVLRDVYGIKKLKSTNEKEINKFVLEYPIIKRLIEYREYAKKVDNYGEGLLEKIHPVTGRLHTQYNQMGAQSGRFSSSDPNLQNIPREDTYRKPFIASPGHKFICADFSQEELRLLAVVANVRRMIDAFNNEIDLHTATASGLFDVPVEAVTKEQRSRGKSMNFAVSYGSTEYGLYKNFDIPLKEGKVLLDKFYTDAYPEIMTFKQAVGEKILSCGYSTTLLGRKRFFDIKPMYATIYEKEYAESSIMREGVNHIIQGTGAEVIKQSLIRIFYENPFGDKLKLLMTVHDEIICEADDDVVEPAMAFIEKIMLESERMYLKDVVPAKIEIKFADHWVH